MKTTTIISSILFVHCQPQHAMCSSRKYPPPPSQTFFHFKPPSLRISIPEGFVKTPVPVPVSSRISIFSLSSFQKPLEFPAHTVTINSFYYFFIVVIQDNTSLCFLRYILSLIRKKCLISSSNINLKYC